MVFSNPPSGASTYRMMSGCVAGNVFSSSFPPSTYPMSDARPCSRLLYGALVT